jgi:hypothetical protein
MNGRSTQPFGRRGRVITSAAKAAPPAARLASQPQPQSFAVSADIVAQIVRPGEKETITRREAEPVRWSYRAAILSGLIIAIINAAANASFAVRSNDESGLLNLLGADKGAVIIGLLIAALWSGARTSALCLLIVHRLLAFLQRTSYWTYIIGGGAVALAYGLVVQIIGEHTPPGGLPLEAISGMGAGLFYRLFAGTKPRDA